MSNVLISFTVMPDDGEPFKVACTSRDVLMWERRSLNNSYASVAKGGLDMRPMYEIAHITARRLGLYDKDLATFQETCDLEALGDDEEGEGETDPTSPAQ